MLNKLLVCVIGRALELFEIRLCYVVFLSNHVHLLLAPKTSQTLADFMQHVFGNVAREAGRLHGWREKFWGRRARVIWVSTEPEAQVARLKYLLEQGVKEGLVWSPYDWPGVQSAWSLASGRPLKGIWIDRTTLYNANRATPPNDSNAGSRPGSRLSRSPRFSRYMPRRLRFHAEPRSLVEITLTTSERRVFLRPSKAVNAIVAGVFAVAAERYEVEVVNLLLGDFSDALREDALRELGREGVGLGKLMTPPREGRQPGRRYGRSRRP